MKKEEEVKKNELEKARLKIRTSILHRLRHRHKNDSNTVSRLGRCRPALAHLKLAAYAPIKAFWKLVEYDSENTFKTLLAKAVAGAILGAVIFYGIWGTYTLMLIPTYGWFDYVKYIAWWLILLGSMALSIAVEYVLKPQ